MESHELDDEVRRAFRRNAPALDRASFCADLATKLATEKRARRRPGRTRLLVGACAAVLVLAAISVGTFELATHLRGPSSILVITDQTTEREVTSSSATTAPTTTTTDFPAPQPQSAWPFPDYTSLPTQTPSQDAQKLANLAAGYFPELKLSVVRAVQMGRDSPAFSFDLASSLNTEGTLHCTVFSAPSDFTVSSVLAGESVTIVGAVEARIETRLQESSQLIARLSDGTVVNIISAASMGKDSPGPLLDREQMLALGGLLVSLFASGEVALPAPSGSTTTTVRQVFLPQDMTNTCWGTSGNFFSYIAYGRKADFITLLAPEVKDQANAIYAAERAKFKASGMSADHYSALYSTVIVQWKDGAYLSDNGYFIQTKPPVPSDISSWLEQDPVGRAAAGLTLWDKTLRWLRLEAQPGGKWLAVP